MGLRVDGGSDCHEDGFFVIVPDHTPLSSWRSYHACPAKRQIRLLHLLPGRTWVFSYSIELVQANYLKAVGSVEKATLSRSIYVNRKGQGISPMQTPVHEHATYTAAAKLGDSEADV